MSYCFNIWQNIPHLQRTCKGFSQECQRCWIKSLVNFNPLYQARVGVPASRRHPFSVLLSSSPQILSQWEYCFRRARGKLNPQLCPVISLSLSLEAANTDAVRMNAGTQNERRLETLPPHLFRSLLAAFKAMRSSPFCRCQ